MRLHTLLDESARRRPQAGAVEGTDGEIASYAELRARAGRVAEALRRRGVGEGDRVGLFTAKSIDAVAAIWGVLEVGAAYVPTDATAPVERAASVLRDGQVAAVLAPAAALPRLGDALGRPLAAADSGEDGLACAATCLPRGGAGRASGDDPLAYVLYTSGSTGMPKGVAHTHGSAWSFVAWCRDHFSLDGGDRFLSLAPFHFDLSIFDVFVSAALGATLVLVDERTTRAPRALAARFGAAHPSVVYATPTLLRLLVDHGQIERHAAAAPKLVLFAGEVFPPRPLRALRALWPAARWANLYGPTETNVCTFHELPADASCDAPPPIGRRCPYASTRIVAADGADAADGGELWVSGGSLMREYWNRPDETLRAVVTDGAGTRWYRTGDWVRETAGGDLVFLGRRDRMVKRRGFRVELGEIEACLATHPGVLEVAVVAARDDEQGVRLVACLRSSATLSPLDLKQFAAERLPGYMVPDRFLAVPELPRTSTDKVDYRSLEALA